MPRSIASAAAAIASGGLVASPGGPGDDDGADGVDERDGVECGDDRVERFGAGGVLPVETFESEERSGAVGLDGEDRVCRLPPLISAGRGGSSRAHG